MWLMNIIDLYDPKRVEKTPNEVRVLLEGSGNFMQEGYKIFRVEMRLYIEDCDQKLGDYSLITSFVETDKGSIEMMYDEGFRGEDSLKRTAEFVVSNLGISALILRSVIALCDAKR